MHVLVKQIKSLLRLFIFISVVISINVYSQTAAAIGTSGCSDANSCLRAINTNTFIILQFINKDLELLGTMASSWLADDKTNATAQMQTYFGSLGNIIIADSNMQNSLATQQQFLADLFGGTVGDFNSQSPAIARSIPNINDLSYPTLLGQPPVIKAAASPYNYVKNASGFSLFHPAPNPSWHGTAAAWSRYANYYNTVMAVESFNSYVLSNQYADTTNGTSFTNTQLNLIQQASNSAWISQIASENAENLGVILRQLLMFESQSYVLLSQLVQLQRQMLTAQVMTNSMLVAINETNESAMQARAQGLQPT